MQRDGEKWLDVGGIKTRYFESGTGEPVLLLHGGTIGDVSGAACAEEWENNVSAISEAGYRVIAVDKLGQGHTGNPLRDEDYSMRGQVAHMAAFIMALGHGAIHLVGHSRGGYVACRLTLEYPELVSSCTIIDSATCAPGAGRNEIVLALNPYEQGSRKASRWIFENYSHRPAHVTDAWLDVVEKVQAGEKYKVAVRKMNRDGLAETVFGPSLVRDRDELFVRLTHEALLRPVMLVWGFNDPTAPVEQGYQLFDLLARNTARCQMHVINEAGHFVFREQPAAFNRVLTEFLHGVRHGV